MKSRAAAPVEGVRVAKGDHVAWIFEDPNEADGALFLAQGVRAGDLTVCLAYERLAERYAAQLRDLHGVGARKGEASPVYFLKGSEDAKAIRGELALLFGRATKGKQAIRLLTCLGWGEQGWPDDDGLLALEAQLNELCEEHSAAALCLYDARQTEGLALLHGALECHPKVLRRGRTFDNPFFVHPGRLLKEVGNRRKQEARLASWIR